MAAAKPRARARAAAVDEPTLWARQAPLAENSLAFWKDFLGLRMGPSSDRLLDEAALQRLRQIIRAVSWVESKHGTAGQNQPARDPMQCGNPGDIWWRELIGVLTEQDRITRAPGLGNLLARELPAAGEAMSTFPAMAKIAALRDKTRGHRGADYTPSHSYMWSVPYLIHRINLPSRATYKCGDVSRQRLVAGAVKYNGGGDPNYGQKIEHALALIGDIPHAAPAMARLEALDALTAGAVTKESDQDLRALTRDVLSELTDLIAREVETGSRVLFPGGIQLLRARITTGTSDAPIVAEIEISGAQQVPLPLAPEMLSMTALKGEVEPDFHEDPDLMTRPEAVSFDAFTALAEAAPEPSGAAWVDRFPGSRSTADLNEDFKQAVERFLAALAAAGATVKISATYRPPERAYLMHHAWDIARNGANPERVPPMFGVNILWAHRDASGRVDRAASRRGAKEMVDGFGMAAQAALRSNHTARRAIDMSISWSGTLQIKNGRGDTVSIRTEPRTGAGNRELHAVGATYKVLKLVSDPPHWSEDGH